MSKRNQLIAIVFALLLFGGGMGAGALTYRYFSWPVKASDDWRERYVAEMRSRVSMNKAQLRQLEQILDETKVKYKSVRDEYRPAMLEVKQEQITRVKAILHPEQVPAYEKLQAEREQRSRVQEELDRQEEDRRRAARLKRLTD